MNKYNIIVPQTRGSFSVRIEELYAMIRSYLAAEQREGRTLRYSKIFLSDAQNQYQMLVESELYQQLLGAHACSVIEQAPLDGSKISVLVKTGDTDDGSLFQSLRLTEEEAKGNSSYLQTLLLFHRYVKGLEQRGLDIRRHLLRTWIYIAYIDTNYEGVVRARNDVFSQFGLTADTHFVASTGIGGNSQVRHACVAIDFLTYPCAREEDVRFLKALDHLNPTHEYGVAFERGTRLLVPGMQRFFISGTASIDRYGDVLYQGDVARQMQRLLENIGALLKDGGATMGDIRYFVAYLRDFSDYDVVHAYLSAHYPDVPHVIVHGPVCRPQWLVEMECIAEKA